MRRLRLGMAQINCTVGDLSGNVAKIIEYIDEARRLDVDLVAFPEQAITGYPPEDLLLKQAFIRDNLKALQEVVRASEGIAVVVGFVDAQEDIYNAAAVISDGRLAGVYHKQYLPNYGVFDENRYFQAGRHCPVYVIRGVSIGVNVCEDIWYAVGPATIQADAGAEVIVNINASPYHAGKRHFREKMLATRASDNLAIVSYTNMVGGQDELVFDGNSLLFNEKGELIAQGKQFEEELLVADLDVESVFSTRLHDPRRRKLTREPPAQATRTLVSEAPPEQPKTPLPPRQIKPLEPMAEVYAALVLGTRDYVHKNGFGNVLIGLSGGVDSSLTAAIAVDALGRENVIGVTMPSRFTSADSRDDAGLLAKNLEIKLLTIPIEATFAAYLDTMEPAFRGTEPNVAEENIQARIRGNILMALSNKFGHLVLTTGNKSELATGYATLYGDMAGGFAVIKDVPKTLVYELARHRNAQGPEAVIPQSVIDRDPSAELRPNQRDIDSLPPYPILDPILSAYVEEDRSYEQVVALGHDPETVKRAIALVDGSEYKRRQAPPGVKITPRALGRDRRLPIVNRYRSA